MTRHALLGAVAAAAMAASAAAPAQVGAPIAPTVAAATDEPAPSVARTITLRELGFESGFEFAGLSGARDLYFPVPAGA